MDLRGWIIDAHLEVGTRLRAQVLSRVPHDRWNEQPCGESASIVWLLWHATRHQDVAIHAVARGGQDVLTGGGWAERVGAGGFAPGLGLSESGDRAAAEALDPHAVEAYVDAVWTATSTWLESVDLADLDRVPDASAALDRLGIDRDEYDWLDRMWHDKPVAFHVRWEATGHALLHLGELLHLRNELR